MATTTTPTSTAPKPATTPAGAPADRKYDPADELSPPYDPAKAEPYKPAPYMSEETTEPAKPTSAPKPASGSTSYNT